MKKLSQKGFSAIEALLILIIVGLLAGVGWYVWNQNRSSKPHEQSITNFDECVAAGNPVMESYPEQCNANGQTFIKDSSEAQYLEYYIVASGDNAQSVPEQESVIKDTQELKKVWAQLYEMQTPTPELPSVDLDKEKVVLIRASSQIQIDPKSVKTVGDKVLVSYEKVESGDNCVSAAVVTYPFKIISIRTTSDNITFQSSEITKNCE